jgi:hypothetical protein
MRRRDDNSEDVHALMAEAHARLYAAKGARGKLAIIAS